MEIMPNSTIKFLRNIPFDNDYNDTIYFPNPASQYNYFSGNQFLKYELSTQYYTRHSAGVINVELPLGSGYDPITHEEYKISTAESLFDCNYIMFCNESFRYIDQEDGFRKKKWFYAFIAEIEYVNNEVARVTFEIDAMQSWMFDYELEQCFIAREHEATDNVGDNLVPENLDLGYETICRERIEIPIDTETVFLVADRDTDGSLPDISVVPATDIPQTLIIKRYDLADTSPTSTAGRAQFCSDLNKYLRENNNLTPDNILYITSCPRFINNNNTYAQNVITSATNYHLKISRPKQIGGYEPKNNKLFTYPYCFVTLSNRQGINMTYKFEYFGQEQSGTTDHIARFVLGGESLYIPSVCMYPFHYRPIQKQGSTSTDLTEGIEYGIVITDFPQVATVGDAYKAWYAQHSASFILGSASAMVGGMTDLTSGVAKMALSDGTSGSSEATSGAKSMLNTITSMVGKIIDTHNMPPSVNGLSSASFLMMSAKAFGYILMTKTINTQQARIIDNYFTMFGYASHKVKVPNTHVRKSWTYTQTVGCTIKGRLPSKYQRQICGIYDKGIRFWVAGKEVGDYTQDNSCL